MEARYISFDEKDINEENQEYDDNLEANIDNEDEEPRVGMTFNSKDELTRYYMNYSKSKGFKVAKMSSKNGDGGKKYFTLACSRAKNYVSNSKNLLKLNPVTKTQCSVLNCGCSCDCGCGRYDCGYYSYSDADYSCCGVIFFFVCTKCKNKRSTTIVALKEQVSNIFKYKLLMFLDNTIKLKILRGIQLAAVMIKSLIV